MDAADVWNAVLDKAGKRGVGSLNARERVIYHLNRLAVDLEMGGLSGFLYNISPTVDVTGWTELHELIASLRVAGEAPAAALLGKVADIVESLPPAQGDTWGELVAPVEARLAELEAELEGATSGLWDKLEVLARQLGEE